MKFFKKTIYVLLSVLIIGALIISFYLYSLTPKYEGEVNLKNIATETKVCFDTYGIPHIYAQSQKDALLALGYVHAQDRLWQMELMRRIAPGRLAEIFGTKALKNDQFFATIGIDKASENGLKLIDKNSQSYQLTLAYLDGINQYIEQGKTPIEFTLLGLKKQKFEVKDVYNIFGFMAFSFAMAQKTDPLLTDIRQRYGDAYLKDFGLDGSLSNVRLANFEGKAKEYASISKSISSLLDQSPIPAFIGSNSWVIGESKTKNGKVIFANDPHIAFSQPGTWYEAHIVTPDYEMYGYHIAGTPFPLLGHNRQYAYGLTMFENDDIDLYQEQNDAKNNAQYRTPTGLEKFTFVQKTIKVKDSLDVIINVKISRHGPIINDVVAGLKNKQPVAMAWAFTQQPVKIIDAVYALCHAKNVQDFKKNIPLIAAPGLNIMYGDASGNISWTAAGKLYKHAKGVNPNFILDGSSGKDDIKEYLDFTNNPQSLNPVNDYVYSANNQPDAINGYLYPGYYLPEDRAKRINGLLQPKNNWNKESVSKMMFDNTSATAVSFVKNVLTNISTISLTANEKQAIKQLQSWHGSSNQTDVAPTIYCKIIYNYMRNTFKDEMGKENFDLFMKTHIMKQMIANVIKNEKSPWWDDISTKNKKETQQEIVAKSFQSAISDLEKQLGTDVNTWTWNRVHTLEHKHAMSKVALLRKLFNIKETAVNGMNEVIDNQQFEFTENGIYAVTGGPSTRRVIDFSDIENALSILPTGESGNFMSPHYDDQAAMYNAGKFRKMMLNKNEIMQTSTKLIFKKSLQ